MYCFKFFGVGAFTSLMQSQDYQYPCYIHLIADAVGQSLSTRPDIIGVEMSKVRFTTVSVLPFYHICATANILNDWIDNMRIYFSIVFLLQALSELHDQIPPFPRNVAMKIMEEEFGCPLETFFSYISEEPIAAASFGQVLFPMIGECHL